LLNTLGETTRYLNDYTESRRYYEEALIRAKRTKRPNLTSIVLSNLGYVNDKLGKYDDALKYHKECLSIVTNMKDKRMIAAALDGFAGIAGKLGQHYRACVLVGATTKLRNILGFIKDPVDALLLANTINSAHEVLGEKAFAEALAQGENMELEDVIALALELNA